MESNRLRVVLGSLLNVEICTAILCNLICLYCIKRGNLHKLKDNPVYLITGVNMVCDVCQLFVNLLYVGPSILLGSWIFAEEENSLGVYFIGTYLIEFWYFGTLIQILLAVNRLYVIVYPENVFFSRKRVKIIMLCLFIVSLLTTTCSQYFIPCCRFIPNPTAYGYSFFNYTVDKVNLTGYIIALPYGMFCNVICLSSYVMLFLHIHNLKKQITSHITMKEIRISIQCSLMFLTYFISWASFHIFPLMDVKQPEVYITTTFVLIASFGVNSFIYLALNKDIHREIKSAFGHTPLNNISIITSIIQRPMQMIRLFLGFFLNIEIWTILITNILCLLCIIKGKLYTPNGNPVYLITSYNLLVDTLQLFFQAFYVGPSVITGTLFFESPENYVVITVGSFVFGLWILGSLIQILMAINRLFVVIFPKTKAFNRDKIIIYLLLVNICGLILISWSQIFAPCCRILPDPKYYGYSYAEMPGEYNVALVTVDLPLNVITTLIGTISYVTMFMYVYRMERKAQVQAQLTMKEVRICFHFFLMFITYLCTWLSFFFFPRIGIKQTELYLITTVMLTGNCGMNSLIYIFLNKNINKQLRSLTFVLLCQKPVCHNSFVVAKTITPNPKKNSELGTKMTNSPNK